MAHSGATDRQVVLRVLGPVGVAGEEAVPIPSSRARALLAMLVLADGDAVPARALVAGLWGSRKPEHPTAALQVVVSRLRTSLGDFGIGVEHTDAGYVLVGSPVSDLARAREAAAEAEAAFAAGSIAESAVAAECGLALWAGSSLADVAGFPFHPEARRRLDSLRVDLVEQRNRVFLRTGRFAEILADIDSWTAIDPWRERLRMQHMIAAYAQQRPVEALSVYDGFRAALVEAFGIEPGHDLRELNRAILRDDPAVLVALESFRRLATERAEVTAEVAGLADTATRLVWLAQHLVGIDGVTVVPGADGERTWLLVAAAGPEAVALRLAVGGEVEPAPAVAAVLAEHGDSARVDRPGA